MSDEVLIWWRDDDAGRDTAAFDALLALAERTGRPLALAVVPAWLEATVTAKIRAAAEVHVLQHGWDHADHAPCGAKRIELGGLISEQSSSQNLAAGKALLERAFGERFLPVLVPPWNRIDERCLNALCRLGFKAVSGFANDRRGAACGLVQVNARVDVIDWRNDRRIKSTARIEAEIRSLLAQPEVGSIGLLSHHLDMTLDDLDRLAHVFGYLDTVGRCRWAGAPELFMSD
jgi:peptidoglycan/xylan/chitin deacetylase (PgdA/CDA1 family)